MFPVSDKDEWRLQIHEEDDVDPNEELEEDEEVSDDVEEVAVEKEEEEVIDEPKEEENEKDGDDLNFEIEEKPKEKQEDEFVIPEKFNSVEEERDFYKENFNKVKESSQNPDVIVSKYEEQLLAKEKDVEELKALRDALKGQPEAMIKIKFKDQLIKAGYDHRLTQEEQNEMIDKELRQSFGVNYREVFDQEDANIEGTVSNLMLKKQQEILDSIEQYNQRPAQQVQPQADPEEARKLVHESLSKVGVKDENINRFIDDLKTTDLINDPVKLYKAVYMDKILEQKVKQAREEGRKEALAEISKVGSKPVKDDEEKVKKKAREIDYGNNYN